jgi:segregation and condensation protein A
LITPESPSSATQIDAGLVTNSLVLEDQSLVAEYDFTIRLPVFEGPFDLLLFFIERDELDIADVPISRLTSEFLAYIKALRKLNIELASEFILVAATLMKIKARMLLPRPPLATDTETDPRQDLIRHLIEYKRFKEVAAKLGLLEEIALARFPRTSLHEELAAYMADAHDKAPMVNLSTTTLALTMQRLLAAQIERDMERHHVVLAIPFTVEDEKARISLAFKGEKKISFSTLLANATNRLQQVYCLMALLELLAEGVLRLLTEPLLPGQVGVNTFEIAPAYSVS